MFDSIIAKEGHKKIIVAFIAFVFFVLIECGLLTFISFVVIAALVYIYRYKYIDFNSIKDEDFVSPISGTVSAIDVKDLKKSIYIDVSLCDSHILRSLDSGEAKVTARRGLNLLLGTFKAKELNEQVNVEFTNSSMKLFSSMCNPEIELSKTTDFKKGEKISTFIQF